MPNSPSATRAAMTQMIVLTTLPSTFWRASMRAWARAGSGMAAPTTAVWLTRPRAPSWVLATSRRAEWRMTRRAIRVEIHATRRMQAMRRGLSTIHSARSARFSFSVHS